ncbi:uncharacterized protein VTP21DRAFT_4804 [Calcarisporiella thermophila]|uniref:uncharacterized protein n=1 Tax=Calcarisporiella thermophila TaxID=911321 RepID=UPI0037447338
MKTSKGQIEPMYEIRKIAGKYTLNGRATRPVCGFLAVGVQRHSYREPERGLLLALNQPCTPHSETGGSLVSSSTKARFASVGERWDGGLSLNADRILGKLRIDDSGVIYGVLVALPHSAIWPRPFAGHEIRGLGKGFEGMGQQKIPWI